jgi:hypothetical protein
VARLDDVLLDEHAVVAEGGAGLGAGALQPVDQLWSSWAIRIPLPPPPAEAFTMTG